MKAYAGTPAYTEGGWTCQACGHYIPPGNTHVCTGYQPQPPPVRYDATFQWLALAERAVKALERIADGLDRRAD